MNYGTMDGEYVREHNSKTAAVIISAHIGCFFSMLLSMYGTIYLVCPNGDEKTTIVLVGIISSMMSVSSLAIYWKYRHLSRSERIFQEQYVVFIADTMVSAGLIVLLYQVDPGVCYETYFHIVRGLHILRGCFSVVMLGLCLYICFHVFCHHTTEHENNEMVTISTIV